MMKTPWFLFFPLFLLLFIACGSPDSALLLADPYWLRFYQGPDNLFTKGLKAKKLGITVQELNMNQDISKELSGILTQSKERLIIFSPLLAKYALPFAETLGDKRLLLIDYQPRENPRQRPENLYYLLTDRIQAFMEAGELAAFLLRKQDDPSFQKVRKQGVVAVFDLSSPGRQGEKEAFTRGWEKQSAGSDFVTLDAPDLNDNASVENLLLELKTAEYGLYVLFASRLNPRLLEIASNKGGLIITENILRSDAYQGLILASVEKDMVSELEQALRVMETENNRHIKAEAKLVINPPWISQIDPGVFREN